MFTFATLTLRRRPLLQSILNITMEGSKKIPARRHPYRGKKAFGSNATPRQNVAAPAPFSGIPRVATPPLTADVPIDTPRFADLAKGNLLHPQLIKTITEDLK